LPAEKRVGGQGTSLLKPEISVGARERFSGRMRCLSSFGKKKEALARGRRKYGSKNLLSLLFRIKTLERRDTCLFEQGGGKKREAESVRVI